VPQFKASLICAAGLRIPQEKWVVGSKSNLTSKLSSEKKKQQKKKKPTQQIQSSCQTVGRKKGKKSNPRVYILTSVYSSIYISH
jgi:hypothetical protein